MAELKAECYGAITYRQGSTIPLATEFLGVVNITTATSTDSVELTSGTKFIRLTTDDTVDLFYELGDSDVEAALTDRVFKADEPRLDVDVEGATHLACIKA